MYVYNTNAYKMVFTDNAKKADIIAKLEAKLSADFKNVKNDPY